uniref:Retrotransposon gag domain-containing protein n=1 Tax=Oryza brachyantha TaxID=4533 RepID=J3ME58_ORYBR
MGPASAWWDNFLVTRTATTEVTWAKFCRNFRKAHIPDGIVTQNKREFRVLQQGTKTVTEYLHKFNRLAQYAPKDVYTDAKRQEKFLGGLDDELKNQLLSGDYADFERNFNTQLSSEIRIHTKKRNKLEHKRLNKLVYVSYNRKMENRFQKIRVPSSQGKRSNPLLLEEFEWENEWVDESCEPIHEVDGVDITWDHVDEAIGATQGLRGRNLRRDAVARVRAATSAQRTYVITMKRPRKIAVTAAQDLAEENDSDHDDRDEPDQEEELDSAEEEMDDEESGSVGTEQAALGFSLDDNLLN